MHRVGRAPEHVDLVYSHRPLEELPAIAAMATELGARAVWSQSALASHGSHDPTGCWVPQEQSQKARRIVQSAGLAFVDDVYIIDAVHEINAPT